MSVPHDSIARRLADHFAPEVGATLPMFTDRLLAGEPPEETPMRTVDASVVLGCAGYLVGLSVLAIEVHRRLTVERQLEASHARLASLAELVAELRRRAPEDHRIAEPMCEHMVVTAAYLTRATFAGTSPPSGGEGEVPGSAGLLTHTVILELYRAALAARLDRRALLAGLHGAIVEHLPLAESHAAQLLCDLDELNRAGLLADGTLPLATWLANAGALAGPRREARVFDAARAQLPA